MTEELKNLRDILTTSLDTIISACEQRGVDFPSLNAPADPSEFSPAGIRNDPNIADAIALGVSAAAQLAVTLQNPSITLLSSSIRHILPASISVVERTHVPEILREAGPEGMHAKEIASKSNIDPKKLARILRYLATNYIFKEVAPDVFANNLISSCLDTGKTFEQIKADPLAKFDNTSGIQAFSSFLAEDSLKASAHLLAHITSPETAFSSAPNTGPMQRAFNSSVSYWDMIEQPGPTHAHRFRRFGAAMAGTTKTQPPAAICQIFDWELGGGGGDGGGVVVPEGGMLVDVGGGMGHIALEVAKVRPDLTFVIEDRPPVIEQAKLHWQNANPELVASGRVHFKGFDFFDPHPPLPGPPSVFLLRIVLHDWADTYAQRLLKHLRAHAVPETRLLVVDSIMEYACPAPGGSSDTAPPAPLLANLGATGIYAYDMDLAMLVNLNAAERTLADFEALFAASGWKLAEVRRVPGSNKMLYPGIIAVPV